ncbi:MAG: histidine phosphatase family protein [Deltaproteobacteria bacterium]|nr:histidine phosphatase family protein [Deltaproteobacteria bacterium]
MKDEQTITRFGLIRHAETRWNRGKRIQGQHDSPLTREGERQAKLWAGALAACHWDYCLCSDLGRARQTAVIINSCLNLPAFYETALREQNWGEWVGKTLAELEAETPETLVEQVARGWHFCPPGGEDLINVFTRGKSALTAAAEKWPGANVLTITHAGMIKCLVYHCLNRDFISAENPVLKVAYLHWFVVKSGNLRLEKTNAVTLHPR